MDYKKGAKACEKDLINAISRVVAVKSVQGSPEEGFPFGTGPAMALKEALAVGEELGFETVNLDNYAGYIQMGQGDSLIGILAHVDVVSEGEGWLSDPYSVVEKNGAIYGRGVCDDKGPAMIALYAMKLVSEKLASVNKRVRLVLGTNEETGMGGIKYYKEKLPEEFDYGFTPDADFPLIYGEKGGYHADFTLKLKQNGPIRLVSISGGEAVNVVCPKCIATLEGEADKLNELIAEFEKFYTENGLTGCTIAEENSLSLVLTGVGAHASMPQLGKNSISYMLRFLGGVVDEAFVSGYNKLIGLDYSGRNCNAYCADAYGELTFNVGMIKTEGGEVNATIDIRYPITVDFTPYASAMRSAFEGEGFTFNETSFGKSLYIDPESDLVKTLYSVYTQVTGDESIKPYTIGGGTYAKSFANMVAFGPEFPGSSNNIHMANECLKVSDMLKAVEIYANAIEKLLQL